MSAFILIGKGEQLLNMGRWQEAKEYIIQGAENAKNENNSELLCQAYVCLGRIWLEGSDFEQALKFFQQSLTVAEQRIDRRLTNTI